MVPVAPTKTGPLTKLLPFQYCPPLFSMLIATEATPEVASDAVPVKVPLQLVAL